MGVEGVQGEDEIIRYARTAKHLWTIACQDKVPFVHLLTHLRAGGPHAQVAARQRVVGATSSSPLAGGLGG